MFWSKKALFTRNPPHTNANPHVGQIQVRIRFGEIARSHKGEKKFRDGLPIIAWYIKRELKGYKAPDALRPEEYPSRHRRTYHTLEELKAMISKAKAAAAPAVGTMPGAPAFRALF